MMFCSMLCSDMIFRFLGSIHVWARRDSVVFDVVFDPIVPPSVLFDAMFASLCFVRCCVREQLVCSLFCSYACIMFDVLFTFTRFVQRSRSDFGATSSEHGVRV